MSAGSEIVHRVINPLKTSYPFVDLLQPQGELLALLLLAFEPGLRWHWDKVARMLQGDRLEKQDAGGLAPSEAGPVARYPLDVDRPGLRAVFSKAYDAASLHPSEVVAFADWLSPSSRPTARGLAALFEDGEDVPPARLAQIRAVMRELLLADGSDRLDGPAEQYGEAARRLIAKGNGVEAVVMGHTHLPRQIPMGPGVYINTGTWGWTPAPAAPEAALAEGADAGSPGVAAGAVGRRAEAAAADLRGAAD